MLTLSQTEKQINELIKYLVEESLTNAQYFAFQRLGCGSHGGPGMSGAIKAVVEMVQRIVYDPAGS